MILTTNPAPRAQVAAAPTRPSVTTAEDYWWQAAVLAAWSGADVVGVETSSTVRAVGPDDLVTVVEIVMTVRTTHDARTLAALLEPTAPHDPDTAWQAWTGWVSALSAERPVLVTVTAPTTYPEA